MYRSGFLNIPPVSDKDLLLCLLQRIRHVLHVLLPIHIPETHTQPVKSMGKADSLKLTLSLFLKLNYIIFIIQRTSTLIGLNAATMNNKSSGQTSSEAAPQILSHSSTGSKEDGVYGYTFPLFLSSYSCETGFTRRHSGRQLKLSHVYLFWETFETCFCQMRY